MNINLRVAKREDCPRLLELITELAVYERAPDAGFGANPVWKAFVAEADESIQGFGLYYIRYSTWKGSRLYLEDLLVTEQMRGKGIGKLIFDRLIQEAVEKEYNGMSWQVLDWNEPAINFYKKFNAPLDGGWLNVSLSKEQLTNFI